MVYNKELSAKVCVVGGGPAGYVAAIRSAQLGAHVILVEEHDIGGACLNRGCIPTKALLKSTEIASSIKDSKSFGFLSSLESINWQTAVNRKDKVVKNLKAGLKHLLIANKIEIIKGKAEILSNKSVSIECGDEDILVNFEKLIIATGAVPLVPPIPGIELEGVMTSNEALDLEALPEKLVIIGAGVIGLEFATMFSEAGVKVIVVELQDRIAPNEDAEIAAELLKSMKRKGISFKLSACVDEIARDNDVLTVRYTLNGKDETLICDNVLVAIGRRLNADAFKNLEIRIEHGAIVINDKMETSIEGFYAAGDITGGKLLAHLAFMEGRVAAENAMGMESKINRSAVPACIYTNPEVASVGITEEEAIKFGIPIKIGRFDFRNNGRALTLGAREGFVKVIAKDDHTIIGAQIMGLNASEIISELTLAIELKAKADVLANIIHPHPSLSEGIWEACAEIAGKPIHQQSS
ncbi:MAG: dihydrolipoyl dehydrogenase [Eubacteriales bacterium]|nr:dihydrolipoyl dehydrogenase [Eubacteriales bacterium]